MEKNLCFLWFKVCFQDKRKIKFKKLKTAPEDEEKVYLENLEKQI